MKFDLASIVKSGKTFLVRKGPQLAIYGGVGGSIAGLVLACMATRKLDDVLEEHKESAEAARAVEDENKKKKALTRTYFKTCGKLIGLYAPAAAVEITSIAAILTGSNVLRKRNVALTAAYTALNAGYKQYRSRVVERFGEQVDRELHMGASQEKIETVEKDENGKEKKVEKTVTVVGPNLSEYARYFAVGEARAAEASDEYNGFFLKSQQELANHMLRARGYLFLNDIYDMLGIDRSIAGQVVGWVYDKNKEDHGDNYVDFGIEEVYRKRSNMPGDYEKVYLLDFNVDGPIMEHASQMKLMTE